MTTHPLRWCYVAEIEEHAAGRGKNNDETRMAVTNSSTGEVCCHIQYLWRMMYVTYSIDVLLATYRIHDAKVCIRTYIPIKCLRLIFREKTDQEMELIRLQRELRDASHRLQTARTKCNAAENVIASNSE